MQIGLVSPLNIDITNWSPLEGGKKTTENLAVRNIVTEWGGLSGKFGVLKTRFLVHEAITGKSKDDVVDQFEECNFCMNNLGKQSRLLASLIGRTIDLNKPRHRFGSLLICSKRRFRKDKRR